MKLFATFMAIIGLTMIGTAIYLATKLDLNIPVRQEYSIEILDEDSVKVYSHSTKKLYSVPFNSIDSVMLIDR